MAHVDNPDISCIALHAETHDAETPAWPHFSCGDGYAWHPDPRRRRCFQGIVQSAPVRLVGSVLIGRPIDRVWSLRQILGSGQPGDDTEPHWPGVLVIIFPEECRGCGGCHTAEAVRWRRAARTIHPAALDALREANPSIRQLLDVAVPASRRYAISRKHVAGIPVCETQEETARAQEMWALDLAARREFPLRRERKRRPTPPNP